MIITVYTDECMHFLAYYMVLQYLSIDKTLKIISNIYQSQQYLHILSDKYVFLLRWLLIKISPYTLYNKVWWNKAQYFINQV